MEYRKLGDLEVSVIGYGAWGIGGGDNTDMYPYWVIGGSGWGQDRLPAPRGVLGYSGIGVLTYENMKV